MSSGSAYQYYDTGKHPAYECQNTNGRGRRAAGRKANFKPPPDDLRFSLKVCSSSNEAELRALRVQPTFSFNEAEQANDFLEFCPGGCAFRSPRLGKRNDEVYGAC